MENNLLYGLKAATTYLNVPRDLARVNSKNEEITTRDGHVYGYLLDIKVIGSNIAAFRAPNSWKMRNSFRKFHAYRDIMFDNVGVEGDEYGRYGKTMRPYLDAGHPNGVEANCQTFDSDGTLIELDGGSWDYTQLATAASFTALGGGPQTSAEKWADNFTIHICEENVYALAPTLDGEGNEVSSGDFRSVGMIHSYNLDRMEVVTPTIDDAITGPSNPLAMLRQTGNQAGGEVIDIAQEQETEEPPYDQADDGDSIYTINAGVGASTSELPTLRFQCFAPAGLLRIGSAGTTQNPITCEVKVVGKVLCKDMS